MPVNPYVKGGSDVPILDGGTGASTAAGARTNLDVLDEVAHDLLDHSGLSGVGDLTTAAHLLIDHGTFTHSLLNVGTTTSAVASGDLAAGTGPGSSGGQQLFYTQSTGQLALDLFSSTDTAPAALILNNYKSGGVGGVGLGSQILFQAAQSTGELRTQGGIGFQWEDPFILDQRASFNVSVKRRNNADTTTHVPTIFTLGDLDNAGTSLVLRDNADTPNTRLRVNMDTGTFVMSDASANQRIVLDDTGFANIGGATSAAALGDFAVGDGVNLMFFDADVSTLSVGDSTTGRLFWDQSVRRLNVYGRATETNLFAGGSGLYIEGDDDAHRYVRIYQANSLGTSRAPGFEGLRSGGTLGAPSTVLNGYDLIIVSGWGYDGTGIALGGRCGFESTTTWTGSDHSTRFFITTTDGTTLLTRWVVEPTGELSPWANNVYDIGTTSLRPRTIYAGTSIINSGFYNAGTFTGTFTGTGDFATGSGNTLGTFQMDFDASDGRLRVGPTTDVGHNDIGGYFELGNFVGNNRPGMIITATGATVFYDGRPNDVPGTVGVQLSFRAGSHTQAANATAGADGGQIAFQSGTTNSSVSHTGDIILRTAAHGNGGPAGVINFEIGAVDVWTIDELGHLVAGDGLGSADNTYDIGDTTNRPRTGYFGTSLNVGNVASPTTSVGSMIVEGNTTPGTFTVRGLANANGVTGMELSNASNGTAAESQLFLSSGSTAQLYIQVFSPAHASFPGQTSIISTGAGVADFRIGTQGVGDEVYLVQQNVDRWVVATGGHLRAVTDNSIDIGATGANRPRSIYAATSFNLEGAAGERTRTLHATAVVDFSVSGTATGLIPAGALVLGVTGRILTAVSGGGATDVEVGDGVDPNRWGNFGGLTAGLTSDPTTYGDNTVQFNNSASAADVVLTGTGGTPTAGTVRVTVAYMSFTAPTS